MSRSREHLEHVAGDPGAPSPDPERLREISAAIAAGHPLELDETGLVLLEADPHRAHTYWHIEPAKFDDAKVKAGTNAPQVLRVYDVTGADGDCSKAGQVFDVEVQGLQGKWYIDMWRHDREFVSEIGFRKSDGGLVSLARSNPVRTPPAEEYPEEKAPVQGVLPVADDVVGDVGAIDDDATPVIHEEEDLAAGGREFPNIMWNSRAGADARREPLFVGAPGEPETPGEEAGLDRQDQMRGYGPDMVEPEGAMQSDMPDNMQYHPEGAAPPRDLDVPNKDAANVVFRVESDRTPDPAAWPSAEDVMGAVVVREDAVREMYDAAGLSEQSGLGRSAEEFVMGGHDAQDPVAPLPLENIVTHSSFDARKKDVLLEVNAELHIYGRAKPNTQLTLYGQQVKTRPDGTFSIRKPLPHGAIILPLLHTDNK